MTHVRDFIERDRYGVVVENSASVAPPPRTHTRTRTHITHMHTHMRTHMNTHMHMLHVTCACMHMCTCTRARTRARAHAQARTRTRTCTHTHAHTHMHMHTQTHTRTWRYHRVSTRLGLGVTTDASWRQKETGRETTKRKNPLVPYKLTSFLSCNGAEVISSTQPGSTQFRRPRAKTK